MEKNQLRVGVYLRPHIDSLVSGDGYVYLNNGLQPMVAVVDGLGHGPEACRVKELACLALTNLVGLALEDILARVHEQLRGTRGAAIFTAVLDKAREVISYFSVGNIDARILTDGGIRHLVSYPGIVGYRLSFTQVREEAWRPGAALVATTDGVSGRWDIGDYPDWRKTEPNLFCYRIVQDRGRLNDDAIALMVRDER